MEHILNLDELILLISNILKSNDVNVKNNSIFKDIIEEHEIIKKNNENLSNENKKILEENKLLSDEITDLKLYTSSLEECIEPNDKAINYLNMKCQNLNFKYDEIKKKLSKLVKQNNILVEENENIIKQQDKIIVKAKQKYLDERIKLNTQIQKLNDIINDMTFEYNNVFEEKNILLNENELLREEITTIKNKYTNEINIISNSNLEQNKIILELENKINDKNDINDKLNKQMEQLNNEMSSLKNKYSDEILSLKNKYIDEISTLKSISELKINSLETENKTLVEQLKTTQENTQTELNKNILVGGNKENNELILNNDNIGIWEQKNTNKRTQLKNKMFFENELKTTMNKESQEIESKTTNNTNNTNISFSTDYMISFLHNENKLKPKEERIKTNNKNLPIIIEESEEINNNNFDTNIFFKNKISSLTNSNNSTDTKDKYIDLSKINNIFVNSENSNKDTNGKIKELREFITNEKYNKLEELEELEEIKKPVEIVKPQIIISKTPEINELKKPEKIEEIAKNKNIIQIGASKTQNPRNYKNKMDIHIIDGIKKMVIGEEMTTLTEQEININDKKMVHLTYNKKFRRFKREQDKQNKLINEFK